MLAAFLLAASLPAFSPSVHAAIDAEASAKSGIPLGAGAVDFLHRVHAATDRRGATGDKSDGRLYLHALAPIFGYAPEAHAYVRRHLDLPCKGPTGARPVRPAPGPWPCKGPVALSDFVELSMRRALSSIAVKVRSTDGRLTDHDAGDILYTLAVLLHAVEDSKHTEGNWSVGQAHDLTSLAHFTYEVHHTLTDVWPSRSSLDRARDRAAKVFDRLRKTLLERAGPEATRRAFDALAKFSPARDVSEYRPSKMDAIFPDYPRRSPAF